MGFAGLRQGTTLHRKNARSSNGSDIRKRYALASSAHCPDRPSPCPPRVPLGALMRELKDAAHAASFLCEGRRRGERSPSAALALPGKLLRETEGAGQGGPDCLPLVVLRLIRSPAANCGGSASKRGPSRGPIFSSRQRDLRRVHDGAATARPWHSCPCPCPACSLAACCRASRGCCSSSTGLSTYHSSLSTASCCWNRSGPTT